MRAEITKEFTFEAAHHLPPVGPDHKCFRVHGHLFRVEVTVAGEVDPATGWVLDFGDLARAGREVIGRLDHRTLNDFPEIGVPTSENLARFLFERMAERIPGVAAVTVHESPSSRCTWRPDPADRAVLSGVVVSVTGEDLLFSSGHFLIYPPGGREALHGHDYRTTLEAVLPAAVEGADAVLREAGRRVAATLDHRVMLPATPAEGRLERDGDAWLVVLPGATLRFPAEDCVVLDLANTTSELLAGHVARAVAADPAVRALSPRRITVTLTEAIATAARASVQPG